MPPDDSRLDNHAPSRRIRDLHSDRTINRTLICVCLAALAAWTIVIAVVFLGSSPSG
jgi:hypothetical protein